MEHFQEGNVLYIDEEYEQAVEAFTRATEVLSNHAQTFLHRGSALLKLKKTVEASMDFERCLQLQPENETALYRLGVALFEREKFDIAKQNFERALLRRQQISPGKDTSACTRYIRKCDAEIAELRAQAAEAEAVAAAAAAASSAQPAFSTSISLPIKYQYYQSNSSLTLSVMAKNLAADDVVVDIQPTSLKVVVRYDLIKGEQRWRKEEIVIAKPLYAEVDAAACRVSVGKTKVEIILAKIEQITWPSLEATRGQTKLAKEASDSASNAQAPPLPSPPPAAVAVAVAADVDVAVAADSMDDATTATTTANPKRPRPYTSGKDWNKIESEINRELEAEKPEGEEALQKLFRQIYKDATPETQMAMKKSFQTSGGTVLSTNWDEVKTTDYEVKRQAPKGMEWRNWDGAKLPQQDD